MLAFVDSSENYFLLPAGIANACFRHLGNDGERALAGFIPYFGLAHAEVDKTFKRVNLRVALASGVHVNPGEVGLVARHNVAVGKCAAVDKDAAY